jgi:hypothetical protein
VNKENRSIKCEFMIVKPKPIKPFLIGTLLILLIFIKCNAPSCKEYCDKVIRKEEYNFYIKEKDLDTRFYVFKGNNVKTGKNEIFEDANYLDLYEKAEIGDILYKIAGKTDFILIKKDTTIKFECICKGDTIK